LLSDGDFGDVEHGSLVCNVFIGRKEEDLKIGKTVSALRDPLPKKKAHALLAEGFNENQGSIRGSSSVDLCLIGSRSFLLFVQRPVRVHARVSTSHLAPILLLALIPGSTRSPNTNNRLHKRDKVGTGYSE
jgi:hypothetical protein